jgi:cytoskeletal protein CcmA (bactofilin family)
MIAENISLISGGVKIEGKLCFPGSVKVEGEVTGDINCVEAITIGRNAKVESKIQTKDALILGYYEGEMHASGQVEIKSTGRFIGNLIQENTLLTIEKGGLFKGKSITGNDEGKKLRKNKKC